MKKVIVISLGGSLIIPEEINVKFLKEFKKVILKNTKTHKFVIVCGGGKTARKYISALGKFTQDKKILSFLGLSSTTLNAFLVSAVFGQDPSKINYENKFLKKQLETKDIIFDTGTGYRPNATSDWAAAEIAKQLKAEFINLTNVSGLYDKNPMEYKNAKFIPKISWKEFDKHAQKIKYQPGMHFVLDPTASKVIMKNKIPTYIIGKNLKNLDSFLKGKKFKATTISG